MPQAIPIIHHIQPSLYVANIVINIDITKFIFSWDKRIRTSTEGTKIPSATITPYPNTLVLVGGIEPNPYLSQNR